MIFSQLPRSQQGNRILLMIWDVENGLFKKGMALLSGLDRVSINRIKYQIRQDARISLLSRPKE